MDEKETLSDIRKAFQEWETRHAGEFQKERLRQFVNESEIPVSRLYTPLDIEGRNLQYLKDVGFPGEYPFVRGISSTMYRGALWPVSHYTGYPTPEESNKLWKSQIEAGATRLGIAYDLPCQMGYDPDHPLAEGEVGRIGVSLVSQRDWEIGFDGINMGATRIYQVFNAPAIVGLANHLCLAQKQGVAPAGIKGDLQNDILKEYTARGAYIFPPKESMRLATDILYYVGKNLPDYHSITVCTVHQSEKGANTVHEAAFALANAFAYIQAAVETGIDVDVVAPNMMFLSSLDHNSFFEEIAKHRAMRLVYARTLKEKFHARKAESMMARFHTCNGGTSMEREQYLNNIARSTLTVLAAALAGCQFISNRPYDEQYGIPTTEAVITSLRISQVVANETGVTHTVDPLGGSYYLEWLTSVMEEKITEELDKIDSLGGVIRGIEQGYFQRVMAEDAYRWQKEFESGAVLKVGVNAFKSEEDTPPARIYRADPRVEEQRRQAVAELKAKRDNRLVRRTLDEVIATARLPGKPENNLVPPVLEAVRAFATVGEICDALRQVWGEYREFSRF